MSTHLALSASPILIPELMSVRMSALRLGLALPLVSRVCTLSASPSMAFSRAISR